MSLGVVRVRQQTRLHSASKVNETTSLNSAALDSPKVIAEFLLWHRKPAVWLARDHLPKIAV